MSSFTFAVCDPRRRRREGGLRLPGRSNDAGGDGSPRGARAHHRKRRRRRASHQRRRPGGKCPGGRRPRGSPGQRRAAVRRGGGDRRQRLPGLLPPAGEISSSNACLYQWEHSERGARRPRTGPFFSNSLPQKSLTSQASYTMLLAKFISWDERGEHACKEDSEEDHQEGCQEAGEEGGEKASQEDRSEEVGPSRRARSETTLSRAASPGRGWRGRASEVTAFPRGYRVKP